MKRTFLEDEGADIFGHEDWLGCWEDCQAEENGKSRKDEVPTQGGFC